MTTTESRGADRELADALVEDVEQTKARLRTRARADLGVVGDSNTEPLRSLLRRHGLSLYPLAALGVLSVVDLFQSYAFGVLAPDISRAMGLGIGLVTAIVALKTLATAVAPLPMAALAQRRGRRAFLCLVTAVGWSLLTLFTGLVTSTVGLAVILVADGLSTGSVAALHSPLLMDSYHPEARVRVVSAYGAFTRFGSVVSPLLVGVLAGPLDLTWRGVFIALGAISTLSCLLALGLRDPGFGRWDTARIRESVHELHGERADLAAEDVELGFYEICRRLVLIPTVSKLLRGFVVFGILLVPFQTFLSFFLDRRFDVGPGGRAAFFAFLAAVEVVALVVYGGRGEKLFRADPAKVIRSTGLMLGIGVAIVAVGGLSSSLWMVYVLFGVASAFLGIVGPAITVALMSIIPARMRPHAGGLLGLAAATGGLFGALFLGGVDRRYGVAGTMVAVAVPGLLGAFVIGRAGRSINADLDRMIDEVLEDEEINRITRQGGRLPMLACRGIDFSYGQLQVLFDVDFTVDDGEMVALLGVNGAGKSTLLRVVSGVGLPSRGTVRYRGQDITYLDAERRVALGITQVPGGRAVFGPMTVVENLRAFGHTVSGDRRRLDRAIDESFAAFPRLAERRNSLAAQLSGGEQQMLGLAKALILQPRLLVIDELSLGLAPVVVGQLLDMVRRINAGGTAVVLVEQSVNIALNLVEHAYFMEKGEMRFDGRARDLLARDDLLRAVFLTGAAKDGA